MAGVYAQGEFKDNAGTEWKAEIYDTTYGGLAYTFTLAENGFTVEHEFIDDKPLISPFCKKTVTLKLQLSENDGALLALIDDLPNGLEDQYYLLLYKKVSGTYRKWWIGMILTDICEYDDYQRFVFTISAKDGLNRLENFEYPLADISGNTVNELLAIKYALSICGVERFYGTSDPYIAVAINWHEVNQDKSLNSLVYTLVQKQSFIQDLEQQEAKIALKGIEDILLSYGASLRFEDGMWRITQIEVQNSNVITWEFFDKAGNYLSTAFGGNSQTIGSDGNITKDTIVHTFMPSLYMITETQEAASNFIFGIKQDVDTAPYKLSETVSVNTTNTLRLAADLSFVPLNVTGGLTRISISIKRNGYIYVQGAGAGSPIPIGSRDWVLGTTAPAGTQPVWIDVRANEVTTIKTTISVSIPPCPGAAPGQSLDIEVQVLDLTLGPASNPYGYEFVWYSYNFNLYDYSVAFSKPEFTQTYEAYNSIYNAASISHDEKLFYCDSELEFVRSSKLIFDGSAFVKSKEWASGILATTGVPFGELICQKSIYFQRKPRNVIQGSFMLPNYNSLNVLVWREKSYLFLKGTFDAETYTWNGDWVELLEETTDVTSGKRNPYRDIQKRTDDDLGKVQQLVERNTSDIGNHTTDIYNLNRIVVADYDSDITITPDQTNVTFTNGAQTTGTTLEYTLPTCEAGLTFHFSNDSNSKTIQINSSTDNVLFAGATGNTLSSSKITYLTIAAINNTTWQVTYCDKETNWTLT